MKRLKNSRHGDMAGVRQHQRNGTPVSACRPCSQAQELDREKRRERAEALAAARAAEVPDKPKVDLSAALARIREYLDAREAM